MPGLVWWHDRNCDTSGAPWHGDNAHPPAGSGSAMQKGHGALTWPCCPWHHRDFVRMMFPTPRARVCLSGAPFLGFVWS